MTRPNGSNPPIIKDLILSTYLPSWPYLETLGINPQELQEASYEMILSNPGDVAIGVNRVQVVLGKFFFDVFDCLVIKHFDAGQVNLMFNTEVRQPELVFDIFRQIQDVLGNGWTFEPKFSTFSDVDKVNSIAKGKYEQLSDEVLQVWNIGQYSFLLNYKLEPLSQLLFSASWQPKKVPDEEVRTKGTLLRLFKFSPDQLISMPEVRREEHMENGTTKFIDYTLQLDAPELKLFDRARLRIFDTEKKIDLTCQMHLSYFSEFEMNVSEVIGLVNLVAEIYGEDNTRMSEMEPHEIDQVEASEMWAGRNWTFNREHKIYDYNDASQSILYQVSILGNPDQDGIKLDILAYNQMIDFQELINVN